MNGLAAKPEQFLVVLVWIGLLLTLRLNAFKGLRNKSFYVSYR
ncbi:hypothetical protein EV14_2142 [Prochlorococcus sp. MIT 0703]|nr:hypothetical protein EV12_1125 [Prochlorococcus sp. MIT 0701]KGG31934.1 hypothetical protein EV14_2142 [Prochlorococcus sp. MIT 0703]